MKRIKVVGVLIFLLSVLLALLSNHISEENQKKLMHLTHLIEQKAFTQEISKSIFYGYRNNQDVLKALDKTMARFMEQKDRSVITNLETMTRWNQFYTDISKFREVEKIKTHMQKKRFLM